MSAPALRLRSTLYVPGANERALEKARGLAADALILDLEDSVAPEAKPLARGRVCELVRAGAFGTRPVVVRINGMNTSWYQDDLMAAAAAEPDAVLVPKVQRADDVIAVERALRRAGAERTAVWAMLETPLAVLRALEIATASERLTVLVTGTNDLLAELHAEDVPGRRPLGPSLSLCLLAARASGRLILDGVYNDVSDLMGFVTECREARRLGFDGKTLIHPSQIDPCNDAFSPSERDIEHARRIIDAFERATQAGNGVVTVDGRMVEALHVESARRVLANAGQTKAST